jgi:hypothetical protein
MVSIDEEEKQKLLSQKIDYIITQVQESPKQIIPFNMPLILKHKLELQKSYKRTIFSNPDKKQKCRVL